MRFLILVLLCLTSCDAKEGEDNTVYLKCLQLDGHTYIRFRSGYAGGLVHNPDCICKKENVDD